MRYIATPDAVVERLKKQAKKLQRSEVAGVHDGASRACGTQTPLDDHIVASPGGMSIACAAEALQPVRAH